jgi:hypothetical protein
MKTTTNFFRHYIDIVNEMNDIAEIGKFSKLEEKWGKETQVSPSERGKYKGKSLEELRKSYNALKASGPHSRGSSEFGRMRELAFAIRAKTGWGGVD